jgi:hypothetical protein
VIGTQTKALFVDAYRDLNARKLFWVVLILTALVVAAFGALGVKGNRLSILAWELPEDLPTPLLLYKSIFSYVVVGGWLTWVATILALISTASIFPDFMAGGAIDLYLSKPIGRLRLFGTKFVSGLLFVLLQVTVFTAGSFLVLGLRAGVWEPRLFLAVPIVVLFFSYLFSICVLLGVLTRSTLAAFFLTLVVWFFIWGLNKADSALMQIDEIYQTRARMAEQRVKWLDRHIADLEALAKSAPPPRAGADPLPAPDGNWSDEQQLPILRAERARAGAAAAQTNPPSQFKVLQQVAFICNTLVPKTQHTIGLLDRVLFTDADMKGMLEPAPAEAPVRRRGPQLPALLHTRNLWWILGSSLGFEFAVLGLAGWRFYRRDY